MPKILLDKTIKFKGNTYKLGEMVEISVEDVETLFHCGKIIEEEQPKRIEKEQPKKSTRKSAKRVDK